MLQTVRVLTASLATMAFLLPPSTDLAAPGDAPAPLDRPGQILHAARAITVRTRGGGNLGVDLPRGRAVQVVGLRGQTVLLEPISADADLLRQFGVRRIPRYAVPRASLQADFLDPGTWAALRDRELARLRARWPQADPMQIEKIFDGEPFIGMSLEQAEEAVGGVIFSREGRGAPEGHEEIWRIGRRARSAELRQWSEGRERGIKARTFEEYLAQKTRAELRFRDRILIAIDATPPGR